MGYRHAGAFLVAYMRVRFTLCAACSLTLGSNSVTTSLDRYRTAAYTYDCPFLTEFHVSYLPIRSLRHLLPTSTTNFNMFPWNEAERP